MSEPFKQTETNPSVPIRREGGQEVLPTTETRQVFGTPPAVPSSMDIARYRSESGTSILPSDQSTVQRHRSPNWWIPGGEYTKTVINYFRGLRG